MSERALRNRAFVHRDDPPIFMHQQANGAAPVFIQESSNAEAFYFQKQIQMQTALVIVLDDGQQIEGYLEWFDKNAVKVRGSSRTLIYKSAIKYLYKAAERRLSALG